LLLFSLVVAGCGTSSVVSDATGSGGQAGTGTGGSIGGTGGVSAGGGGAAGAAAAGAAGNLGTSGAGGEGGSSGTTGVGASGAGAAGTTGAAGRGGDGGAGGNMGQAGSAAGASGGALAGSAGNGGTAGTAGMASLRFSADRVIVTGVRATATPAAETSIQLHNGGATAVQISSVAFGGSDQSLFQIASPPNLPATLMPGADMPITVRLVTTGGSLPAAPANKDSGCNLLTATLTATSGSGSVQVAVYGLLNIQANYEATLGQILTALGYKLNVGRAQNNWNPNSSMNAVDLPGVETGTDEVSAPHFTKVGSGPVTMTVVARFSPYGALPFGWYPATSSTMRNVVGTMAMITDAQTNNKARMVFPPLAANSSTTFDPGAAPFGLWVYSDQVTQKYESGGKAANGDYDFSADALNTPANVHRFKTYPLKDATGTRIATQYLVAVEEAGNGDYQDYVFVLGNVAPAP
jgi:hypothetical protein